MAPATMAICVAIASSKVWNSAVLRQVTRCRRKLPKIRMATALA
jgi:hypothetical protein